MCNLVNVHLFVIVCRDRQVTQDPRVIEVQREAVVPMDKMDLLDRRCVSVQSTCTTETQLDVNFVHHEKLM